MVDPHAGQKIGLQLKLHIQPVLLGFTDTPPIAIHLIDDPQQLLYMMTHLMGCDIGHGQVTLGTEIGLQLMKEIQVDIHLLICRTVERTYSSRCTSTFRYRFIGESHQRRFYIALLQLCTENFAPDVIGTVEYAQGKHFQLLILVDPGGVSYFCRLPRHHTVHHVYSLKRILSQQERNDDNYNGSHSAHGCILSASSPASAVLEIGLAVVSVDPLHVMRD